MDVSALQFPLGGHPILLGKEGRNKTVSVLQMQSLQDQDGGSRDPSATPKALPVYLQRLVNIKQRGN